MTQITDPFGRSATLGYDSSSGWLNSLTDAAGLTSSFQYQPGSGWATALTTPYGTTSFNYYQLADSGTNAFTQLALYASEPTGAQQLYLYQHNNPFLPSTDNSPAVPGATDPDDGNSGMGHTGLNYRNSYYWGRRQFSALAANNAGFASSLSNSVNLYQASVACRLSNPTYSQSLFASSQNAFASALTNLAAADFNKAEIKHWLMAGDQFSITDQLSSDRDPSPDAAGQIPGLRTWYDYPSKSSSDQSGNAQISCVARLLPDGTSQYTTYHYYPITSLPGYPAGSGLVLGQ